MKIQRNEFGCLFLLGVVFGPGLATSFALHRMRWAFIIPVATVALLLAVAALPLKRKVTPEQYANELERHLLGTDDDDEWDETSLVLLSDARLERLRRSLPASFDRLSTEQDRMELSRIIDALRRGEFPEF